MNTPIETSTPVGGSLAQLVRRPLRFTLEDTNRAGIEWRFNCGPGALCAVLDMTPDELRPKLHDFERKGYTNPTLMKVALCNCDAEWSLWYRADNPGNSLLPNLDSALVRVQWSGPWTRPGVPMRVRYRQTHWIGVRANSSEIFDINAMSVGGWITRDSWENDLVPWLIGACVPRGDGGWWPTHVFKVKPNTQAERPEASNV